MTHNQTNKKLLTRKTKDKFKSNENDIEKPQEENLGPLTYAGFVLLKRDIYSTSEEFPVFSAKAAFKFFKFACTSTGMSRGFLLSLVSSPFGIATL